MLFLLHFNLKKKGKQLLTSEEVLEKEERKLPTKIVRPNIRHSPKPSSWEKSLSTDKVNSTASTKSQGLKPVSRGKPLNLQKQKKVNLKQDKLNLAVFKVRPLSVF